MTTSVNGGGRVAMIIVIVLLFTYVVSYVVLTMNGSYAIRLERSYYFVRSWHIFGTCELVPIPKKRVGGIWCRRDGFDLASK
jgi:hypothetical protein